MNRPWPCVAVALPGVGMAVVWVCALTAATFGQHPMWLAEPLTLSEAAALRDGGAVARLVEDGADPGAVYAIRAGFLFERDVRLAPADAAIAARRPEILALLFDLGLSFDEAEWARYRAGDLDRDIQAVLDAHRPSDLLPDVPF